MATPAQIEANRKNAQQSLGPTSPEGKARSCRNRLSYGFAGAVLFIPGEDREQFNLLLADLHNEFQPATASEQIILEKMAQNQWISLRAYRFQSVALCSQAPGYMPPDLALLIRYHQTYDRGFYKARTELLNAQKERRKSEIGFESSNPVQPVETPPESPDPAPNPSHETTVIPSLSIPTPLQWHDFDSAEDQLAALMTGPDGEMAKTQIAELLKRRQAA